MEQVYAIVSELGAELGDPLGPAQPLGGRGGRDYRVRLTTGEYVVRLPRQDAWPLGVSRESERLANETASSLGIAPAVAGAGPGWLVTRYLDRRAVDPGPLRGDPGPVAGALRSFHESGLQLPARCELPQLPDAYASIHRLTRRIAEALPLAAPVPCHNRLHPGSVLDLASGDGTAPPRIALVDWEYAAMGDRLFDLASLAVHNDFDEDASHRLLAAYDGDHPTESRLAALQLMKLVVLAREAAGAWTEGDEGEQFEPLLGADEDPLVEEWLRLAAA
ncbi:MAG: phosphotransferase [Solirubrobacteraceae bacterium]